ncbi:hypothetical protein OK016_25185 [Vibrio chagasii]|nr:hypothetical protein [Vibrio chagasii]
MNQLDALNITTSDDILIPLSYTLSVDGKVITAQVGGETIFTLTLAKKQARVVMMSWQTLPSVE